MIEKIIVGLGNPGKEYENTRHNIGFRAVDFIAGEIDTKKFDSLIKICDFSGKSVLFLKPQTYMNLSGSAVQKAMYFYKIKSEDVLLIFDDICLEIGRIRVRKYGSHGGHNGLKSIFSCCNSQHFPRIKIGVGQKPEFWPLDKWVISNFSNDENKILENRFEDIKNAASMILNNKIDDAMSEFNAKVF